MSGSDLIWFLIGASVAVAVRLVVSIVLEGALDRSRPSLDAWARSQIATALRRAERGGASDLRRVLGAVRNPRRRNHLVTALAAAATGDQRVTALVHADPVLHAGIREWAHVQLSSDDADRRAEAVEVCGALRPSGYLDLVRVATLDPDDAVQACACAVLLRDDPSSAEGVLLRLIEEDGRWAAELLAADADASSFSSAQRRDHWGPSAALATVTSDMDRADPTEAAFLLGSFDDASVTEALDRLHADAVALALPQITRLLERDHEATRLAAVEALGRSRDGAALLPLASRLADPSRIVRLTAARAIGSAVGPCILEQLRVAVVRTGDATVHARGRDGHVFHMRQSHPESGIEPDDVEDGNVRQAGSGAPSRSFEERAEAEALATAVWEQAGSRAR